MIRWTIHLKGALSYKAPNAALTVRDNVYQFGGYRDHIDVHIFNTVALCWRKLTTSTPRPGEPHLEVPSGRRGHTAVLVEDTVFIWGGYCSTPLPRGHHILGGEYYNVLYAFDVDAHRWFKPGVTGTVPEGRYNHSAFVLGKVMFIYGGSNHLTEHTNDMYKLDASTMVWSLINTRETPPPNPRWHSATIIGTKIFVIGPKMFVSGGLGDPLVYNTLRVFDTETNGWLSTPSAQPLPVGRAGHSAFTYNGELYIFGGRNSNQTFNDLWKFNPETFSWKEVEAQGKLPCLIDGMCCCIVGDRMILFGGYNGWGTPVDDLFILDLSPTLQTLCKLVVILHGLDQSELPHDIRWELAAMMADSDSHDM